MSEVLCEHILADAVILLPLSVVLCKHNQTFTSSQCTQAFAALPDDQFQEAASSAAAAASADEGGAQVELAALRALSNARKIRIA